MKALITAAGIGSRFGYITERTNKCLLKVGRKSIIEISIDILNKFKIKNKDIVVVTGHFYDQVQEKLKRRAGFVYNPFYSVSGILPSIWFAREHLENSSFIFVTGDSLYHPNILKKCINSKADIAICLERKRCDADDSKVMIRNGKITNINKNIKPVEKASAEFIGMAKVSNRASGKFFETVEEMLKRGRLNAHVADVLMKLQKSGIPLDPVYTDAYPRIEVDYPEDLEKAREIFKNNIRHAL